MHSGLVTTMMRRGIPAASSFDYDTDRPAFRTRYVMIPNSLVAPWESYEASLRDMFSFLTA